MKLATFLLNNGDEYMGHKQIELGEIPYDTLRSILEELQSEDPYHLFFMKVFTDGSGSVEQAFYWKEGEHPSGHTDRTILGFQLKDGGREE